MVQRELPKRISRPGDTLLCLVARLRRQGDPIQLRRLCNLEGLPVVLHTPVELLERSLFTRTARACGNHRRVHTRLIPPSRRYTNLTTGVHHRVLRYMPTIRRQHVWLFRRATILIYTVREILVIEEIRTAGLASGPTAVAHPERKVCQIILLRVGGLDTGE